MLELLQNYSLSEILIFIVVLGLAIKGVVSFWDWASERLRKTFKKETQQEKQMEAIQDHLDKNDKILEKLSTNQDILFNNLQTMSDKITLLIDSDKDAIKSYITQQHHLYCYQEKWIDDYTLDSINRRYEHYLAEGGNTYVEELVTELRALPKVPPQDNNKE